MVKDIIELYSNEMTSILIDSLVLQRPGELDDELLPKQEKSEPEKPEPRRESAVVMAVFLSKIITEVSNCVNDINGLSLRGGAFMILVELMQRLRWKFVKVICMSWGDGKEVPVYSCNSFIF
jgi:exocyst complex component 2